MIFRIVVLKFVTNIIWKHLCLSFFIRKLQALKIATLIKINSNRSVFLLNLRIFYEYVFYKNLQWLLLTVSGFQHETLIKNRLQQRYFTVQNIWEHILTEHLRMITSCVYLWIFRSSLEHLFLYRSSGKVLISCTNCSILTSRYSKIIFKIFKHKTEK